MLVSGFPGRGYLSAASPMLVALCTCEIGIHEEEVPKLMYTLFWCKPVINVITFVQPLL